jgi:hypothetical protein
MYNTIPDYYRREAVNSLFDTATLRNCWLIWKPEIHRLLGNNYSETEILNLGDHLSDIFRTTGIAGRTQGELSAGGTAWESLVCWYINLCLAGSRTVAIKKMSQVPSPIQHAITVNYGNFACNTESDITVITFPDSGYFNSDYSQLQVVREDGTMIEPLRKGRLNIDLVNYLVAANFSAFEIGIIQCKTNWNDNSQIPMLWDMIYSAGGFRGRNITIGRNSFSIQSAKSFTYSFVTVPTNQKTKFKDAGVAVKRVTNLSGGNYWGQPTKQNIAKSVKEIFTNNFQSGARKTLRDDLKNSIPNFTGNGDLSYFGIHSPSARTP